MPDRLPSENALERVGGQDFSGPALELSDGSAGEAISGPFGDAAEFLVKLIREDCPQRFLAPLLASLLAPLMLAFSHRFPPQLRENRVFT